MTKKGRVSRSTEGFMFPQESKKGTMQGRGCNREAAALRNGPAEEAEKKTTARRVETAQKPKRQSLIHNQLPKNALEINPKTMNASHKIQQKSESATVLRKTKIGSCLSTKRLFTLSKRKVRAKSKLPKAKLQTMPFAEGKRGSVESPTRKMQTTDKATNALLKVGRKKSDE